MKQKEKIIHRFSGPHVDIKLIIFLCDVTKIAMLNVNEIKKGSILLKITSCQSPAQTYALTLKSKSPPPTYDIAVASPGFLI